MKKTDLFFAFILVPLDIAMILLAFFFAYSARSTIEFGIEFADIGVRGYLVYAGYIIPIWIALFAANGLYNIQNSGSLFSNVYRIFVASSVSVLLLIVGIYLTKTTFFSRIILVLTWLFSLALLALGRIIIKAVKRYLLKYGIGVRKALLIGDNQISQSVTSYMLKNPQMGIIPIGIINGAEKESKFGLRILGSIDNLRKIVKEIKVDEVILTDTSLSKKSTLDIIQITSDCNSVFKYIPDTFSIFSMNHTSSLLGTLPVIELKPTPLDGWGRIIKRVCDIIFSTLLLIILSPLFAVIALLVKVTSKGPVLYASNRIGRDEQTFCFYKFRSMYIEKCDFEGGVKWTTKEDEKTRITPLGLILRKLNLDELPQLWNIVKGEMSFVGPRPEQPKLVEKFEQEFPEYFRRHKVKSGLTGWAQVNGLKGDTSVKERVKYDIYYIEKWSLWFDLKIILRTFWLTFYEAITGKFEYRTRP